MATSELLFRLIITYIVLFSLTRIMGRKEISQMTFFNFVSAISIGSISAGLIYNKDFSILNGIIALVGWSLFTIIIGLIDIKSKRVRKVTTGEPVIVIKDGQIMKSGLRKTRLDLDELNTMLRLKNAFKITDVEYAIFETNGKLSVMKKDPQQPLTKGDMNIPNIPKAIPIATEVISDGTLNISNLARLNLDQNWLDQQLQQAGVSSISEVFYAEAQPDGTIYIDKKEDNMNH